MRKTILNSSSLLLYVLFCTLTAALAGTCPAQQVFQWNNASNSSSFWDITTNWTPGQRPGSIDTASFALSSAYEVWFDDTTEFLAPEIGTIDVSRGNVTFLNQETHPVTMSILDGFVVRNGPTQLINRGVNLVNQGELVINGGATFVIDGSHVAGSELTSQLVRIPEGTLAFDNGAIGTLHGACGLILAARVRPR